MELNLVKHESQDRQATNEQPVPIVRASIQTLEAFNVMLNEPPPADIIKVNKFAGNSKFLPISFIQMELDQVFVGLWETENFSYTVVANELAGRVTLKYFHPFAKVWLRREGSAAVMIQQNSGADITDIGAKIKNTLGKDLPHLLASCTASAARTIGARFGRDLNRKEFDTYETLYGNIAASEEASEAIDWTVVTTIDKLKEVWNSHPALHNNPQFSKKFTFEKNRLAA